MEYKVLLEHDAETGHWGATVAGLPEIIVDGRSEAEAVSMAKEAIQFYVDETGKVRSRRPTQSFKAKLVTVHV